MNRGLLVKAWRESWPMTLFLGLALGLTEAVIVFFLWGLQDQLSELLARLAVVHKLLQALLGASVAGQIGPDTLQAIAWIHPLILILGWAHATTYCTRVPAGEVDRGTIDVVLALPVSRWELYRAEAVVWLVSGLIPLLILATGHWVGSRLLAGKPPIDPRRLSMVMANIFCLYLWVGALACLVSALCNRRGKAVAVALAVVLVSFLWNYLAQYWSVAQRLSFLSMLNYYRPLLILRDAAWPLRDMAVLAGTGFAFWVAGGFIFARRDLATL